MTVLLVGDAELAEIDLLADAITDRGGTPEICDVNDWPGEAPLTFTPGDDEVTFGTTVSLDDVTGMFVSSHHTFRAFDPRLTDYVEDSVEPALNQFREHRAMFQSLCHALEHRGATVVPPIRNHYWQDRKPWQIDRYADAELPIPDTVFTNHPEEVRSFAEKHERVVYKPVARGGPPHILSADDLTEERLEKLATAPVQFQAYVPGDDLRVFAVDGKIVGATRYETENFSFKIDQMEGKDVDVHAVELPDSVVETVESALECTGMEYAAADVRLRDDGTHWLIELNEAGRFAIADISAGQNVAGELAEYLLS
jgi:glutathione synthase/RimK-type ligase-like ATP-grasp enzyme